MTTEDRIIAEKDGSLTVNVNAGGFTINTVASKVRSSQPVAYRLVQKINGTLVLQGAFYWTEGSNGGHDWEDIPTIIEAQKK
jgi:hypothetical protein